MSEQDQDHDGNSAADHKDHIEINDHNQQQDEDNPRILVKEKDSDKKHPPLIEKIKLIANDNTQKDDKLVIITPKKIDKSSNDTITFTPEQADKSNYKEGFNMNMQNKNDKQTKNKIELKAKDSIDIDYINENSEGDDDDNNFNISQPKIKKEFDNFVTDEEDNDIFVNAKVIKHTDYGNEGNDESELKFSRPVSRMRKSIKDIQEVKPNLNMNKKSIVMKNYDEDQDV